MSTIRSLFLTFTTLAFAVSSLCAGTLYVSGEGNDANAGTSPAQAFRSLQKAADLAEPGDTVLVGDGTYLDSVDIKDSESALLRLVKVARPDAWITFRAAPGAEPVLRPRGWTGILISGSYYVIDGLAVTGFNDSIRLIDALKEAQNAKADPCYNTNGINVRGRKNPPSQKPHHVIIRNCTVSKVPGCGIGIGQSDYITIEDNLVFDNCWFMRFGGSGITTRGNWPHDDAPGYHYIIQRNKIWNNKTLVPWGKVGKLSDGNGILLDVTDLDTTGPANTTVEAVAAADAAKTEAATDAPTERPEWKHRALIANNLCAFNGGSGIHVFRTAHVDFVNNTTYWNSQVVNTEELYSHSSRDVVILNNIIVPAPAGRVTSNKRNTDVRWDHNLYPVAQQVFTAPNDLVADPLFVKVARDLREADFRLRKNSPALQRGTKELLQPTDLAGKKRRADQAPDLGAYER